MDGGLSWVYPIDLYDEKKPDGTITPNFKTLGFYLKTPDQMQKPRFEPTKMKINSLKSTLKAMYNYLSYNSNSKHIRTDDKKRTVFIDALDIKSTQFDI